jgi:two-component system, OmpR family, sensor histidine kinase KdpD
MPAFQSIKTSKTFQYLVSFGLVLFITLISFFSVTFTGHQVVALILLMVVSLLAMVFEITPVLLAAALSALLWNFLFIPPTYTVTINTTEDALLFLMYFVVAMLNAVLTSRIRRAESKAREREGKEATIKLYNTLLNSLSHELRTPISTIIGAVDTLKDNRTLLSNESKDELLHEIDIASIRLNRQVENLLNMSRLESGFLQPKSDWSDLNELIHSIVQMHRNDLDGRHLLFDSNDSLPLVKIDRGLLEPCLHNLIQNAIAYTPVNSIIEIRVGYEQGDCFIEISDNGKGFPEDKVEFVFEKFYRLPDVSAGGTGLGLSIVKGFVEAQKGKVILENRKPHGARFTLSIPAESSDLNQLTE